MKRHPTARLFKVPYLLVWSAPVATLFASAFAVNRLGRDNEITCIRGAGVSLRRICLPIAAVGLLASVAAFLANERLVPWAERKANTTMREMALQQAIPQIQPNVFFNSENYWFYIGSVQKIGIRPMTVVAVDISIGRNRCSAASTTVSRISSTLRGRISLNRSCKKSSITTAASSTTPNKAMKPTQTAILKFAPQKYSMMNPPDADTRMPKKTIKAIHQRPRPM